jgi:hypothetical protein
VLDSWRSEEVCEELGRDFSVPEALSVTEPLPDVEFLADERCSPTAKEPIKQIKVRTETHFHARRCQSLVITGASINWEIMADRRLQGHGL